MRVYQLHPKPILSVLIPHLKKRRDKLNRLMNEIIPQVKNLPVEILINDDEGEKTTGEKRNELVEKAVGTYVVFIDDDDSISETYFEKIFPYLDGQTDCIGFLMELRMGEKKMPMLCCASVTVPKSYRDIIFRPITHIQVVKKSLCVPFPHITRGEDVFWTTEMKEKLMKSNSRFIYETLYYYNR